MNDPARQERERTDALTDVGIEVVDLGADVSIDGIIEVAVDGLALAAEFAGDVVGGLADLG